jgi:hypothetical protein
MGQACSGVRDGGADGLDVRVLPPEIGTPMGSLFTFSGRA